MSNRGLTAVVYTDGACVNQGLPNAKAGYGIYWGENHQNNRSGPINGVQDNNRAELAAAQLAIHTAINQGYSAILIYTDASYVRDAIANSANFQTILEANRDIVQSIQALKGSINIQVQLVPAHSGVLGNTQAHNLATAGTRA